MQIDRQEMKINTMKLDSKKKLTEIDKNNQIRNGGDDVWEAVF